VAYLELGKAPCRMAFREMILNRTAQHNWRTGNQSSASYADQPKHCSTTKGTDMTIRSIIFVLIAIGASGCGALSQSSPGNRDYLLGWYKLEDRDVIIPVFKAEGGYYTVSWPGAEIPLKQCPEGLEWGATPSSMAGTKIIYDMQSSRPYCICVHDSNAMHHTASAEADWWGTGKKRPLTKIDAPTWLPDPTTERPHSVDDFLGWYVFAWMPVAGIEIRKNGEKYFATWRHMVEPDKWEPSGSPSQVALAPLSDRLGFTVCDPDTDIILIYHKARKRYELTGRTEDGASAIRSPLARVRPEVLSRTVAIPSPPMDVGIPCWH